MRAIALLAAVAVTVSVLVIGGTADASPTGPSALDAVNALVPTPNTAWGIDPATGQLRLTVSDAAPAAGVARLLAVAERFGPAVRVTRIHRPLTE